MFDGTDVQSLLNVSSACMVIAGLAALVALMVVPPAEYGRYSQQRQQRAAHAIYIPAKIAWMTQELPSLVLPLLCAVCTPRSVRNMPMTWKARLCFACFVLHYVNRAVVYPWRLRGGQPTRLYVWLLALLFCCWNGINQGVLWTVVARQSTGSTACIAGGFLTWLFGAAMNVHADMHLRSLRAHRGTGYGVPHGGLFEYVSAANYCGEIIEWVGYAVAAWQPAAAAFAVMTCCNLVPRALRHHAWYRTKFGDNYPRHRKAVIPFIL